MKLTGVNLAKCVLIVTTVGLLVYEGWSLVNDSPGDTLSEGVWSLTQAFPVVLFFAGLLCGHWFWPRRVIAGFEEWIAYRDGRPGSGGLAEHMPVEPKPLATPGDPASSSEPAPAAKPANPVDTRCPNCGWNLAEWVENWRNALGLLKPLDPPVMPE